MKQLSLFVNDSLADYEDGHPEKVAREERLTEALLDVRLRYGDNAVLKASSLLDYSTERMCNNQIGGHRK